MGQLPADESCGVLSVTKMAGAGLNYAPSCAPGLMFKVD